MRNNIPSGKKVEDEETRTVTKPFLLISPIPDFSQLTDEQFEQVVDNIFYQLILIHNKYHCDELNSMKIMDELFSENIKSLSNNDLLSLAKWFTDTRFLNILYLLQFRKNRYIEFQKFSDSVIGPCKSDNSQSYLSSDIQISHAQIWASFIGSEKSILSLLTDRCAAEIDVSSEKEQELKKIKNALENEGFLDGYFSYNQLGSSKKDKTDTYEILESKIIKNFMCRILNDTNLKIINFFSYVIDQKKEYSIKKQESFNDIEFIYDVFFSENDRGFFRSLKMDNIELWLLQFFESLLLTLNSLKEKDLDYAEKIISQKSKYSDEEEFMKILLSTYRKKRNILKIILRELNKIIDLNSKQTYSLTDYKSRSSVLKDIFLKPANKFLDFREKSQVDSIEGFQVDFTEESEVNSTEESIKKDFLRQNGVFSRSEKNTLQISDIIFSQLIDNIIKESYSNQTIKKLMIKRELSRQNNKEKENSYSSWDIVWIGLSVVLAVILMVAMVYLTVQTLGIMPAIMGGTGFAMMIGASAGSSFLSAFIGFRKQIKSFFISLFGTPVGSKKQKIQVNRTNQQQSRKIKNSSVAQNVPKARTREPVQESKEEVDEKKRDENSKNAVSKVGLFAEKNKSQQQSRKDDDDQNTQNNTAPSFK